MPLPIELEVVSDVFAGRPHPEDGESRDELAYYVTATRPNGQRFAHFKRFTTVEFSRSECEARAKALAQRISDAIVDRGAVLNLEQHWRETYPVYGSAYYQGSSAEQAFEQELAEAQGNGEEAEFLEHAARHGRCA